MKKRLTICLIILCCHNLVVNATTITSGTLNIDGEDYGQLYVRNDAIVNVLGDTVSTFYMRETSIINVLSGDISGEIVASDQCRVNIKGGSVNEIKVNNDCLIELSGGQINSLKSFWTEHQTRKAIILICDRASINYDETSGTLTGTWLNGEVFSMQLSDYHGMNHIYDNISFIPEPGIMTTLILGACFVFRRNKILIPAKRDLL